MSFHLKSAREFERFIMLSFFCGRYSPFFNSISTWSISFFFLMSVSDKAKILLSLTLKKEKLPEIEAKLNSAPNFTAVHPLQPNTRLNYLQILQYVSASNAVKQCGGKYIVFITDVEASQNHAFNSDKEGIDRASEYAIEMLKHFGVEAEFIKSSDYSLNNHELFFEMVKNSITISVQDVANILPPKSGKEIQTASNLISPCLEATEMTFLKADFIITSEIDEAKYIFVNKFDPERKAVVIPMVNILNLKNNMARIDVNNNFFVEDEKEATAKKAKAAFCTDEIENNPIYNALICIFVANNEITISDKVYKNVDDIKNDFAKMEKKVVKDTICQIVTDGTLKVREEFKNEKLAVLTNNIIDALNPKKKVPAKKQNKKQQQQQK